MPTIVTPAEMIAVTAPYLAKINPDAGPVGDDMGPTFVLHDWRQRVLSEGDLVREAVVFTGTNHVAAVADVARDLEGIGQQVAISFHRDTDGKVDGVTLCLRVQP